MPLDTLQALKEITTEVSESNIRIILSSTCFKARRILDNVLRKKIERQNDFNKGIDRENFKLEAEIKHAELEVKSYDTAQEIIKSGNVETIKELLLAKYNKQENLKRVAIGEQKYEKLWLDTKKTYESIPYLKDWSELTNENKELNESNKSFKEQAKTFVNEIKTKKLDLESLDKKQIIELAKYYVHERPAILENISGIKQNLQKLSLEIAQLERDHEAQLLKDTHTVAQQKTSTSNGTIAQDDPWLNFCGSLGLNMPKLEFGKKYLDLIVDIKQIEKKATTCTNTADSKLAPENIIKSLDKKEKKNDFYIPCVYDTSYLTKKESEKNIAKEPETKNFARKKLINILEDISIHNYEAHNIISSVNPNSLKVVNEIKSNGNTKIDIEDDITEKNQENTYKNSEKGLSIRQKRKLSFNLPVILEDDEAEVETVHFNKVVIIDEKDGDIADMSGKSKLAETSNMDEKHGCKMDLSPDNRNNMKKGDDVIASKFFKKSDIFNPDTDETKTRTEKVAHKLEEKENEIDEDYGQINNKVEIVGDKYDETSKIQMEVDDDAVVSSPKNNEDKQNLEKPVGESLFSLGTCGTVDTLDVSISTTYYDEEGDVPSYLDTSLLLSPKVPNLLSPEIPNNEENVEVFSEEVPNFLAGPRKTGLSFFGKSSGSNTKSVNQENNFNFNFGGDNKKGRGGLFSMFH